MTILNIHIKDEDKKKVQELAAIKNEKSMSEFIRKLLAENVKIQEISEKRVMSGNIEIPEYIPKNKYVGFVNGAIIAVADSPSEISRIAAGKVINSPLLIKFNGPKKKRMEYCFLSLSDLNCWNYAQIEDYSYPVISVGFKTNVGKENLFASIDTAASLCVLRKGTFNSETFEVSRKEKISTATGIVEAIIYSCEITLIDSKFKTEFILAPIADLFPFQLLIGRNLLDKLDAYFFGKRQIFCLKLAE